ncbi:hypothetical protein [Chromobacterium amazonense]|uniref:hypothetical protein n=1 Tax=Chromobacterium amazonense TaxID=1382803 RepID=UPI00111445DD|nr:hypothetical protein [Chromobacterium amazonense]
MKVELKVLIFLCICLFPLLVWLSIEWFAAVLTQMFIEPDLFADCMLTGQISEFRAAMDACLINSASHMAGNCDMQCDFNGLTTRLR